MPQKPRHLKTATQTWVMDNRKRLGETSADLARLTGVTTDTARGWESRGAPSEDAIQILERHFGVPRPVAGSEASNATDPAALLERLDRYADLVDRLIRQNATLMGQAGIADPTDERGDPPALDPSTFERTVQAVGRLSNRPAAHPSGAGR